MFGPKVKLDKELYEACKQYAVEAGYSSVEEFVSHVLQREINRRKKTDKQDEAEMVKKLQGLGYID